MYDDFAEPIKTDPDTVDISIFNVAITENNINTAKGDVLSPAAYDTLNVGDIVTVVETLLNNGRDPTVVQVDAWKAKLAAGDKAKEVQEGMLALIQELGSHVGKYFNLFSTGRIGQKRKQRHPLSK